MRHLRAALAAALLCVAAPISAQAVDPFAGFTDNVQGPCRHWTTVTPSDTTDLALVPKALFVGGAGDIAMIGVAAPVGATGVVWKSIPTAALLPVRPRRILATGTTATLIVACF